MLKVIRKKNKKIFSFKKIRPFLPDYILDFGHVILGTVKTHGIRAANIGKIFGKFRNRATKLLQDWISDRLGEGEEPAKRGICRICG
jgi:hypothetical protein